MELVDRSPFGNGRSHNDVTDETLLLRQVNPGFIQNNRPSSQVFRPTPKDENKLSVYDGDLITPEQSWKHFTNDLGYRSVGVWAVTVRECRAQSLTAVSSPEVFEQHAHIDFTGCSTSQAEKKGKKLLAAALVRGWLYQV
jgi:hypothetical protein